MNDIENVEQETCIHMQTLDDQAIADIEFLCQAQAIPGEQEEDIDGFIDRSIASEIYTGAELLKDDLLMALKTGDSGIDDAELLSMLAECMQIIHRYEC